jgi:hypothetical protein
LAELTESSYFGGSSRRGICMSIRNNLVCQTMHGRPDGNKELCGSSDTRVIAESKFSIVYHCNVCRMNSIIIKDFAVKDPWVGKYAG